MSKLTVLPKILKLRLINQIVISNIRQLGNCSSASGDYLNSFEKSNGKLLDISVLNKENFRFFHSHSWLWKKGDGTNSADIDQFRANEEKIEREYEKQEKLMEQNPQKVDESLKTESTEDREKIDKVRSDILEASLKYVTSHGWSLEAISHGAESINYPGVAHGMFPNGGIELIHYFYTKCNKELIEQLQREFDETNGAPKSDSANISEKFNPRDFAIRAIRLRLEMIIPYKDTWPQAIAIMTLPQNVPTSLAQLLTLVDDICYCAGDRSVDIGWYTRRIGIASIYKMVELYLLQDKSQEHRQTWEFLEARMDEAIQIQEFLSTGDEQTQKVAKALGSAFQTARNILGINCDKR